MLLAACVLVHPYLLAMAAGVLGAVPLSLLLRYDRRWRAAALWFAAALAVAAGLALGVGFGGASYIGGYGVFSMNLLSPVLPSWSWLFGHHDIDATGGQAFEGGQYLGAGLLLLCVVAAGALAARRARLAWRRHLGLAAMVAGMVLFALSNKVYAGHLLVLDYHHPPAFLTQFRASGRFFWPASYLILLTGVVCVMRALPLWAAAAVLLGVTALQAADTTGLRNGDWTRGHSGPEAWSIDAATLRPVLARHTLLTIWPTFDCGARVVRDPAYLQLLLLGSETGIRTNTMYSARLVGHTQCDPVATLSGPWQPHELRVLMPYTSAGQHALVPGGDRLCHRLAGTIACSADDDPALLDAPGVDWPAFPIGQTIAPGDEPLENGRVAGWGEGTPQGIWTIGPVASLRFKRPQSDTQAAVLTAQVFAVAPAAGGTQTVRVFANDALVATWVLPDIAQSEVHAVLPATDAPLTSLRFEIAQPTRPIDRHMNFDERPLGFYLKSLRLDPQ